jgi:hypothetical protein
MRTLVLAVLFAFALSPLLSQQKGAPTYEDAVAVYEDLFTKEKPLHLTLKFDVKALQKTKYQDVTHEAEMSFAGHDDIQVNHPVQLKSGESIRQKICYLPPLWVKITDSGIKSVSHQEGFRMHIITRCKSSTQYESYVLREYLAYKLYNLITPLSYRVRLVKLSIIDTGRDNEVTEDWAFIQEPDELMALRLNAMMIENDKLSMPTMNPEVMNSLSMYQYMIGNPDYSVTGRHNLNILTYKEYGPEGFIPIPYDFNYSGLVNAEYAIPGEALGTSSVRERYYLGPCRPEEVHNETIQELSTFKDEIMAYIKDFEYLDDSDKADMIGYLDSFFKESEESGFIDQKITPTCR